MAWIREIPENEAEGDLTRAYEQLIASRGKVANILKVHSLDAGALNTHLDLYMHIMFGKGPLARREREAVAVAVSAENRCPYCVAHHLEALMRYEKDEATLDRIKEGNHEGLDKKLAAMLEFARFVTREPHNSSESRIAALRDAGLGDEDILRLTLVIAYFNFVNRIALSLGVAHSEDEVEGYKVE